MASDKVRMKGFYLEEVKISAPKEHYIGKNKAIMGRFKAHAVPGKEGYRYVKRYRFTTQLSEGTIKRMPANTPFFRGTTSNLSETFRPLHKDYLAKAPRKGVVKALTPNYKTTGNVKNVLEELTFQEWLVHLRIVAAALPAQSLSFAVALSWRATEIFGNSFRAKKFEGKEWDPLVDSTVKKRKSTLKRHTTWHNPTDILRESGDLSRSIKQRNMPPSGAGVYTDPSEFKRDGRVYAAVHNFGLKAGRSGHQFQMPQRQFMGHSSALFTYAREIMSRYLLNGVFTYHSLTAWKNESKQI